VVLSQPKVKKLKLEYLKSSLEAKKKDINTEEKFLPHSSSTFFEFSSSLLLEYGLTTLSVDFLILNLNF